MLKATLMRTRSETISSESSEQNRAVAAYFWERQQITLREFDKGVSKGAILA
jgi:hypothetical protein